MLRNPKLEGTNLYDCIPQKGPCPNNCNQCFYNHAFYLPIDQSHMPTVEEVGDGILRVNSGHDSNIDRDFVIKSTDHFSKRFFNTSIPEFDFPGPVVYTANASEEDPPWHPGNFDDISNIMFVRLRVSSTNLIYIFNAAHEWSKVGVPVVLTFMRYCDSTSCPDSKNYEFRKSIKNNYWCPIKEFVRDVMKVAKLLGSDITMCGTPESGYCKDCLNCERFYYQAAIEQKQLKRI